MVRCALSRRSSRLTRRRKAGCILKESSHLVVGENDHEDHERKSSGTEDNTSSANRPRAHRRESSAVSVTSLLPCTKRVRKDSAMLAMRHL